MARKSKCTDEVVAKVVEAIKLGATYDLAARYAGIDERTFYRWMNDKSQFCQEVKAAEGAGAFVWLAKIQQAANDGDWHAAAWKLERRYPDAYGRTVQTQQGKVQIEHSGPNGSAIPIQFFDAAVALATIAAGSEADL